MYTSADTLLVNLPNVTVICIKQYLCDLSSKFCDASLAIILKLEMSI